ncbi:MAG: nucleotidyltransferase domain-containing protein [Candidatus Izemoplasmataceae bacterium]
MVHRDDVVKGLKRLLEKQDFVIAAWEGGSAATNKLDEYSDLDVLIVCCDDSVELVFDLLDDHLEYSYGIVRKYRVGEPTWHKFSQAFYQIKGTSELFYLDIAVIKESIPDKFTDPLRHGEGVFWFVKRDVFHESIDSLDDVVNRCKRFYKQATESDFLLILETKKALVRGDFVDAFPMYYGFIVRHLVVMLNLKNRKEKVDFNLRYINRDYEEEDVLLIYKALKVSTMTEMREMFSTLLEYYLSLKEELYDLWG